MEICTIGLGSLLPFLICATNKITWPLKRIKIKRRGSWGGILPADPELDRDRWQGWRLTGDRPPYWSGFGSSGSPRGGGAQLFTHANENLIASLLKLSPLNGHLKILPKQACRIFQNQPKSSRHSNHLKCAWVSPRSVFQRRRAERATPASDERCQKEHPSD